MRPNFAVSVAQDNKPLAGAGIDVYKSDLKSDAALLLSGKSNADGTFSVSNLRPGNYWLGVTLLGVRAAGSDCFHVADRPSKKAERALEYSWGDNRLVIARAVGKLVEHQPGGATVSSKGALPLLLPIKSAKLTLRNVADGASYTASSGERGEFAFESAPSGIYVLEVQYENQAGSNHGPDHVVIEINPNAQLATVSLMRFRSVEGGTYLMWSTPRD